MKIIDFGCGQAGLFEVRMAQLLNSSGHRRPRKIYVEVLALDVVQLECADNIGYEDENVRFNCITQSGDYTTVEVGTLYDHGVFCMSMLSRDALEVGLKKAIKVIRPGGIIYIVEVQHNRL